MSEEQNTTVVSTEKVVFTPKEEEVLKAVWHCLKSIPEVDMNRLKEHGNFNTVKTASNTWGVIKKKLNISTDSAAGPKASKGDEPTTPKKSPTKKPAATPRKRNKQVAEPENEADESSVRILKKSRKSPVKKEVQVEATETAFVEDNDTLGGEDEEA